MINHDFGGWKLAGRWLLLVVALLGPVLGLGGQALTLAYHQTDSHAFPAGVADELVDVLTDLCAAPTLSHICFAHRQPPPPPPHTAGKVVDSGFCRRLPAGQIEHSIWHAPGNKCQVYTRQNGQNVYTPAGIPEEQCFDAILTQRLCRENMVRQALGVADLRTSCIPGFEISCQRLLPADIQEALLRGYPTVFPAIQTDCTNITVGNVGYSDLTLHQYQIGRPCLQAPHNRSSGAAFCEFLGQSIHVDNAFCQVLTRCVEPQLSMTYPVVGYAGRAPIYDFPSGARALKIDLSCSDSSTTHSLHNTQHGCRAIDINVHENYGNLRPDAAQAPVSNMPPEFVAIMESCNIIWGGRYNGAQAIYQGCDPMEFAYAPACEIRGYSYSLDQNRSTAADTIMDVDVLHLILADGAHPHPDMLRPLIPPDHPFWSAMDEEWWFHLRTYDGTGTWSHTAHYRVANSLELNFKGDGTGMGRR